MLANVARERSVVMYDGHSLETDRITNNGLASSEVWLSWMPQCLPLTVDARRIQSASSVAAMGLFGAVTASGTLVLSVVSNGGISFGDASGVNPV